MLQQVHWDGFEVVKRSRLSEREVGKARSTRTAGGVLSCREYGVVGSISDNVIHRFQALLVYYAIANTPYLFSDKLLFPG